MSKSYFDGFLEKVKKGKEGDMIWVPSPYKRWKNKIGLSRRFYTLIGGDSSSGKSAFVDRTYVLHTYQWYMANKDDLSFKPKIILRSMERSKEFRIAKWVCYLLYQQFNILIDVKTVFGMHTGDSRVSDDLMKKIEKCRKYIENMENYITVIDGKATPFGVYSDFREYALENGELYRHTPDGVLQIGIFPDNRSHKEWKTIPKDRFPDEYKLPERYEKKYIPDDEDEIVIPIVDHIQKYESRQGHNRKQTIDKGTEFSSKLRDLYGMSPIDVSQFNRNKSDSKRRFSKKSEFKPEENDFKNSGDMYSNCDVCIAAFNPKEYGVNEHLNYPVNAFTNSQGYNRFRAIWVLKNTYGPDNFGAGFHFIGEIGKYDLLPKPNKCNARKYANIEKQDNIIDIVKR